MSGRNRISLHKGSLVALQKHLDGDYPGMRVAFARSADTPFAEKIGRKTLTLLEVVPGTTVWDVVVGRDWKGKARECSVRRWSLQGRPFAPLHRARRIPETQRPSGKWCRRER